MNETSDVNTANAEDRKERRRKLGLPEELTPEEVEAEKEKERQKAEKERLEQEKKAKAGIVVVPVTLLEKSRAALVEMKKAALAHGASDGAFSPQVRPLSTALLPSLRHLQTIRSRSRRRSGPLQRNTLLTCFISRHPCAERGREVPSGVQDAPGLRGERGHQPDRGEVPEDPHDQPRLPAEGALSRAR